MSCGLIGIQNRLHIFRLIFTFRYYEEDAYDRRSIQRSLSQPSLARSATEFTERWVIPDDVSENSSVERPRQPSRILVSVDPFYYQSTCYHISNTINLTIILSFRPHSNRGPNSLNTLLPSHSLFSKVPHLKLQLQHHHPRNGIPAVKNKANQPTDYKRKLKIILKT